MNTIKRCPVCGSKDLFPEYRGGGGPKVYSGRLRPPSEDGCFCGSCGVRLAFNREEKGGK